ncbi:FCD domain-containing protein [Enterovibrio sp. ZSDZ35]|uniref:FCD domain-containing protein n=1 Tax=Enterovibrio qingdaonensis TaxID=2899818 RepID=A0ABT5QP56_9GAMM|nr:FCD domain-containing protein [Enterovibrio sp. ZSDZ35]MDD1782770.1 FCD domain-containing protein [Enterovibrio sp. ZSDZ35]
MDKTIDKNSEYEDAPPNRGRAADEIIESLEQQIVSGKLENNAPLPSERSLMEMFNASRTVIREAIVALENRGLIINRARYRPIVRKPDYHTALDAVGGIVKHFLSTKPDIKHLYDMRVFVERTLVRDAATKASKEDIQALKAALAANKAAINDSLSFYHTDKAFHYTLYTIADNPILPAIHQGFTSWLAPHWDMMERDADRNQMNYIAHEAIYLAILERDPDAAEQALLTHLETSWEQVSSTF